MIKMEKIIKKYAIVDNGTVVNMVLADEEFAYQQGYVSLPEATIAEPNPPLVDIGWQWTGFRFLPPARNIEAEWSWAVIKAQQLLEMSNAYVAPDLWMIYTNEQQQAWANYRQELRTVRSRFEDPADIVWPVMPKVDF